MEFTNDEDVVMDEDAKLFQELQDEYIHYETITAKICNAPTILKNIFGFLTLEELKTCRYVCKKWDSIVAPLLRKRSRIVFNYRKRRTDVKFFKRYEDAQSDLHFDSFSFSVGKWPLDMLKNFIQQQIKYGSLQELELDNIILTDKEDVEIEKPVINNWLEGLKLKKLSILCDSVRGSNDNSILYVSLDTLTSVKEILFHLCNVNVRVGNLLTPTVINMVNVKYYKNGNHMKCVRLNDIIDFKDTESIIILNTYVRDNWDQKILLDLQKCEKLRYLELNAVKVTNWSPLNCNIDVVTLEGTQFTRKNSLTMKTFQFAGPAIDYSVLSPQLEIFSQRSYPFGFAYCSQPINLPNLKHLDFGGQVVQEIHHFKNCPNLTAVSVQKQTVFDLELLPKNVKQIQLSEISIIKGLEGELLKVDLLILISYTFKQVEEVLQKINPKVIKIYLNVDVKSETIDTVLLFLTKYKHFKKVYVGSFSLFQDQQFTNSALSKSVDRKADFYCFQNQKGTAMSKYNFCEVMLNKSIDI